MTPVREPRPTRFFELELLSPRRRDRVELRFAILLGRAPLRAEPSVLRHAMQRRVERSFFDAQQVRRHALDVRRDRVPVHAPLRIECLEHEEHERALQDVVLVAWHDTDVAMPS